MSGRPGMNMSATIMVLAASCCLVSGNNVSDITYPYNVTGVDKIDGLPTYFGNNEAEACPPALRRSCSPCPHHSPCDKGCPTSSPTRCCVGSFYCEVAPASYYPRATPVNGTTVMHPMSRTQILERALGWVALGTEYKWAGDGSGQPGSAIETCARPDSRACPTVWFGGRNTKKGSGPDCCALVEMAWGTGLGCLRSEETSIRVDCADVKPGDAVSYSSKGPGNDGSGFPPGSHIFLFRRWSDMGNKVWNVYQMGGEKGKANSAAGGEWPSRYNPSTMYCLRRVNLTEQH